MSRAADTPARAGEQPSVRPADARDAPAVARLLYETSPRSWDLFTGSRERALSLLGAALIRRGNDASAEVLFVAEVEGQVAAALACFPVGEAGRRARRTLWLAFRHTPPWQWPQSLWVFLRARGMAPPSPGDALYVDALATDRRFRRRGAARALLAAAEARAGELGLAQVALDTDLPNTPARSLYESAGFDARGSRPPRRPGLPGYVLYVKDLKPAPISGRASPAT